MSDDDDLATEAELAHVRARVRSYQRRQWLAKAAGVSVTLAGLLIGLAMSFVEHSDRRGRSVLWIGLVAGGLLGSMVWRRLEPKEDIDDL